MYKKIENIPPMTDDEACHKYPNHYILMQMDGKELLDPQGVVLYVGDNFSELFAMQIKLPVKNGVVIEGVNISNKLSLGGLVLGA